MLSSSAGVRHGRGRTHTGKPCQTPPFAYFRPSYVRFWPPPSFSRGLLPASLGASSEAPASFLHGLFLRPCFVPPPASQQSAGIPDKAGCPPSISKDVFIFGNRWPLLTLFTRNTRSRTSTLLVCPAVVCYRCPYTHRDSGAPCACMGSDPHHKTSGHDCPGVPARCTNRDPQSLKALLKRLF